MSYLKIYLILDTQKKEGGYLNDLEVFLSPFREEKPPFLITYRTPTFSPVLKFFRESNFTSSGITLHF